MSFLQKIIAVSAGRADFSANGIALADDERRVDYATLRRRSNALAHLLAERFGVSAVGGALAAGLASERPAERFVAVLLPRSVDFPTAVLGIWKAGMAYVPLSASNSASYNRSVLSDASPLALVTTRELWNALSGCLQDVGIPLVFLDETDYGLAVGAAADSDIDLSCDSQPAVLIYTSGTTGRPKAVLHSFSSLSFLFDFILDGIGDKAVPGLKFACTLDFCFIACLSDLFAPLMFGGTCLIVSETALRDLDALAALLKKEKVYHMLTLGSLLAGLLDRKAGVQLYVSTGSRMPDWKRPLPEGTRVRNVYGMTEFGAGMAYDLKGGESPVPIGKAVRTAHVYLLDEQLNPVEKGETGEIFICSDGLSMGYYRREELTRERFLDCPFEPGRRMFRTGDFARELPSGDWLFCGRRDDMVKVRGVRLNLTQIEDAALAVEGVCTAAAVLNERGVLCLIYTGLPDRNELLGQLKHELPLAMMPGYVARVEAVPVNAHGKIDHEAVKRLVAAGETSAGNAVADPTMSDVAALQDPIRKRLLSAMRRVLGHEAIGLYDDFFDLGGDSLNVMNLLSELPDLPLRVETVYRERTAAAIAAAIEAAQASPGRGLCHSRPGVSGEIRIALSAFQRRVLESQLTAPDSVMWNNPVLFCLGEDCRLDRLREALLRVSHHHPALGCVVDVPGRALRYRPDLDFSIEIEDFPAQCGSEPQSFPEAVVQASLAPFDMENGPLWRIRLYRGESGNWLFMDFHHMIFDGTSLRVFMEHLFRAYRGESLPADDFFQYVQAAAGSSAAGSSAACVESAGRESSLDDCIFSPFPLLSSLSREGEFFYRTETSGTRIGREDVAKVETGHTLNVCAIAAAARALAELAPADAADGARTRVAVNWMSDGRTSASHRHSFGAYVKMYTLFLNLEDAAESLPDQVQRQVERCLSGQVCEYGRQGVIGARDPVLINNMTDLDFDFHDSPFGIGMSEVPYNVYEPTEYLDVELFYRQGRLFFNLSSGCRVPAEKETALFEKKFTHYLEQYIVKR